MSNDKLIFIVVIILGFMILYNYYIVLQTQEHIDNLYESHINTQDLIKDNYKQDLAYITKLTQQTTDLEDTLATLKKERDLIKMRHADITARLKKIEEELGGTQ